MLDAFIIHIDFSFEHPRWKIIFASLDRFSCSSYTPDCGCGAEEEITMKAGEMRWLISSRELGMFVRC